MVRVSYTLITAGGRAILKKDNQIVKESGIPIGLWTQ
jgi:hypothetical protein